MDEIRRLRREKWQKSQNQETLKPEADPVVDLNSPSYLDDAHKAYKRQRPDTDGSGQPGTDGSQDTMKRTKSNQAAPSDHGDGLPLKLLEAKTAEDSLREEPRNLSVITWNLDGLDQRSMSDLVHRTAKAAEELFEIFPHAVMLQEVVDVSLNVLGRILSPFYHLYKQGNPDLPYFVVLLARKDVFNIERSETVPFRIGSKMGRALVKLRCSHKGDDRLKFSFLTSHLESTKGESTIRKEQLKFALEELEAETAAGRIAFLGGDLNLRDEEFKAVKKDLPQIETKDAWESAGSPVDKKFTWDCLKNDNLDMPKYKPRCRFDRLYFLSPPSTNGGRMLAESAFEFSLLGLRRADEVGRFPSDHFGILSKIRIVERKDEKKSFKKVEKVL